MQSISLLLLAAGLAGCAQARDVPTASKHAAAAAEQKLPAASEIRKMVVVILGNTRPEDRRVVVPATHIPKIWAKIEPATVDNFPLNWKFMGYDFELTLTNGIKLRVWLFTRKAPPGAFAAGPTWKKRTYYRGGNSQELRQAVKAALKEAQRK